MVLELAFLCLTGIPAAKPLAYASRDGDVEVRPRTFRGASAAVLEIENRRLDPLQVDVNGSYLLPEDPSLQRLGIGLVRAGDADTTIQLAPRGRLTVRVLSVCMDQPKSSPGIGSRYKLAVELAPGKVLKCLRRWRSNPHIPQDEVQFAVWAGRLPVLPRPPPASIGLFLPELTEKVLAHDGRMLVLTCERDLFAGSAGRSLQHVSARVIDLWAASGGSGRGGLYAIRERMPSGHAARLKTVVSHYDPETRGWHDLPIEVEAGRLRWVASDASSVLVVTVDGNLKRFNQEQAVTVIKGAKLLEVSADGKIFWVPDRDRSLLVQTNDRGEVVTFRHSAAIHELACAEDGLYFVDRHGSLFFIQKGRSRRLRGDVSSIEASGDRLLVIPATEGTLLGRSTGALHIYQAGRPVRSFPPPVGNNLRYLFDSARECLLCLDQSLSVRSFRPASGCWSPPVFRSPHKELREVTRR